jgi:hypothetical protein
MNKKKKRWGDWDWRRRRRRQIRWRAQGEYIAPHFGHPHSITALALLVLICPFPFTVLFFIIQNFSQI